MGTSKVHNKYSILANQDVNLEATDFNLRFRMSGTFWQVATISGTATLRGGYQRFYSGTTTTGGDHNYTATTTFQSISVNGSGQGGDNFVYIHLHMI